MFEAQRDVTARQPKTFTHRRCRPSEIMRRERLQTEPLDAGSSLDHLTAFALARATAQRVGHRLGATTARRQTGR
jgi:hypothetical protein